MSTPMKFLAPTILLLVGMLPATADDTWFLKAVKASLVFQDDASGASGYPHVIEYLYRAETETIGLNAGSREHLREVARKLLTINVRI
jgi:hypothetical protein